MLVLRTSAVDAGAFSASTFGAGTFVALCLLSVFATAARAADLDTVEQRVRASLLTTSLSTATIQGYQSTLAADGSWTDVNYADTTATNWLPLTHLSRLREMARAYNRPGHALYQNAALQADILRGYDYWLSRNPTSTNWYQNEIGGPQALGDVMVLMKADLSAARKTIGAAVLSRAYVPRTTNSGTNTGQNRVWRAGVGVSRGIVGADSAVAADAFAAMADTILVSTAEGIQRDGSFHQHGPQLYNQGYGSAYSGDTLRWAANGAGTAYAFLAAQRKILVDYLLDGTQWFVRGQAVDYTAMGREVSRTGRSTAADGFIGQLANALSVDTYRAAELQAFKTRLEAAKATGSADPALAPVGHKHFWRSDVTAHNAPAYHATVKLSSPRTSQPESGNSEGLQSLHLGDGVNLVMRTGNEYDDIMPVWNWRRLPGTTTEQGTYSLKPTADWGVRGTSAYAGGASDGKHGVTAFNYSRLNVAAKKAWFFFDGEFVALGAGITAPAATGAVETSANQSLLSGAVTYKTTASQAAQTLAPGTSAAPAGLTWVNHDGTGYFFADPQSAATIQAVPQSGTWASINAQYSTATVTKDVFGLYLGHGTRPSNATYAYTVVPGLSADQMDAYQANSLIQILRNDSTVQAVRHAGSDVTQAAFYAPATLTILSGLSLTADKPSTVQLDRDGTALAVSAASPEALAMTLTLRLTEQVSGPGAVWSSALGYTTLTFALPGGDLAGSTVTQQYQIVPEPGAVAALASFVGPLLLRRRRHRQA
jgi:chondroitin AC lyase